MLDDLLDAPLGGARRGMELGLGDVEAAKGVGEFAVEFLQIGVGVRLHPWFILASSGRITLHGLRVSD